MKKYLHLSLQKIHEALVKKEVTPFELTTEAVEAAKKNLDNAFEIILEKEALEKASKLTLPEVDNIFWGIPFVVKDNFSTKDVETTASSNSLKGYIPLFDATVIKKLKEAKAILIAKTTMDELAMGGNGTTSHKGYQYNPYDPSHQHVVGGSSSGSAIAVSAGIVPFSLGSDTGDSVRRPASFAGLVGYKPTWGKISRYGLFPFAPSLDHVAYFTRNVFDAVELTNLLSGIDEMDMTSQTTTKVSLKDPLTQKFKVAVISEIYHAGHDETTKKVFQDFLKKLPKEQVSVEFIHFNYQLLQAFYPLYLTISSSEATSNNANIDGIKFGPQYWGNNYQDMMFKARNAGFSELIKRRFIVGSLALMKENQHDVYFRALKGRRLIVNELNKIFKDYDLILVPATPSVAPKFLDNVDRLNGDYLIANNHLGLANFGGLPSVTLPLGFKDNLPFGLNITGRIFEDEKVLNFASLAEKITGLSDLIAGKGRNHEL